MDAAKLKDMKLAICTPFYSMNGFSPYISSLVSTVEFLSKAGINFEFWELSGDSYVFRARNTIAKKFLDSDRDYLFFIDSDESWTLDSFINVLTADEDIVGGLYPCKNNWEFYGGIMEVDENRYCLANEAGLLKGWGVPTGFMKIHRSVFERLAPTTERYKIDTDQEGNTVYCHNFFGHIIRNEQLFGEDISFNIRCEDAGIPRWVHPDCTMGHYGIKEWTGNFHEYLKGLKV